MLTSAALITLLAPVAIRTPMDFVQHVILARGGWLFEAWLALGGVLAAPIFASSVVSMPLLLGLIPVIPVLGHASWHAYRAMVDASGVPPRDPDGGAAASPAGR